MRTRHTIALTLAALFLASSASAQKRTTTAAASTVPGEYSVLDYGAACNGTTDDTIAIQAAITAAFPGGTVLLPATRCAISQTLTFSDPTTQQRTSFISMRGQNPISSQLAWRGSTDAAAMRLVRNKFFTLSNFGILNMAGARGTSRGLELSGYGGVGTETLQGDVNHVVIQGFSINLHAGAGGAASSEMKYDHLVLDNADVCWQNDDLNTLNHNFTQLSLGNCGIGLWQRVGNVTVRGGDTWGNGIDFSLTGDVSVVEGVRAELKPGGIFIKTGAPVQLRVSDNLVTGDTGPTTYSLWIYVARHATVVNNYFRSQIYVEQYVDPGSFILTNNMVNGPADSPIAGWGLPDAWDRTRFVFTGNANGEQWFRYPDVTGIH